jgi:hypothetical protein
MSSLTLPIDSKLQKRTFVDSLAQCGLIKYACQDAAIDRGSVVRWRNEDPEFMQAMEMAKLNYIEVMEEEADRRGRVGWKEPIFDKQGNHIGDKPKHSDVLLIFRLKGLAPDKYADRKQIDSRVTVQLNPFQALAPSERAAELKRLQDISTRCLPGSMVPQGNTIAPATTPTTTTTQDSYIYEPTAPAPAQPGQATATAPAPAPAPATPTPTPTPTHTHTPGQATPARQPIESGAGTRGIDSRGTAFFINRPDPQIPEKISEKVENGPFLDPRIHDSETKKTSENSPKLPGTHRRFFDPEIEKWYADAPEVLPEQVEVVVREPVPPPPDPMEIAENPQPLNVTALPASKRASIRSHTNRARSNGMMPGMEVVVEK